VTATIPVPLDVSRPTETEKGPQPFGLPIVLLLVGGHVLLGLAATQTPVIATAHAGLVAIVLCWQAVAGKRLDRLLAITAYGALCDAFWRMNHSRAPWEFSKYILAFGAAAILWRYAHRWQRALGPLLFVALLIPGIMDTALSLGPSSSRQMISFSEMGIISLALGALAFRQIVATEIDLWNLLWVMLGPIVAALSITTYSTLTAKDLTFTDESNFAVTGGFGPNQISSILGLGMLFCVLLIFLRRDARNLAVSATLGVWFTWATFLTFSRGGMYSVAVAAGALLLVGTASRGSRVRSVITLVVGIGALLLVFSSVNTFTGNILESRYSGGPEATAGRTTLAKEDFHIFAAHPLWGVGTGQSENLHVGGILNGAGSHTEYSRLIAEHGIFGLAAIGLLGGMAATGFRSSRSSWNRLLVAGAAAWSLTTMLHGATRLAAVGLLFALSQLRIEPGGLSRSSVAWSPTLERAQA
jgi:hypothetical protein